MAVASHPPHLRMIRHENVTCTNVLRPSDFYVAFRENFRTLLWVFGTVWRYSVHGGKYRHIWNVMRSSTTWLKTVKQPAMTMHYKPKHFPWPNQGNACEVQHPGSLNEHANIYWNRRVDLSILEDLMKINIPDNSSDLTEKFKPTLAHFLP